MIGRDFLRLPIQNVSLNDKDDTNFVYIRKSSVIKVRLLNNESDNVKAPQTRVYIALDEWDDVYVNANEVVNMIGY